jgi:hypothetical protein
MTRLQSYWTLVQAVLAIFALTSVSYGQSAQSEQSATPAPSMSQTAVPVTMTECEGINNCATWTFLGAQGNGQWPTGEIANLSVEHFDAETVVIRRADSTGSSAGLTAVYKGTRHGDRIGGEFTSSWPGHGDNISGNWYATIATSLPPPLVIRFCLVPSYACSTVTWNNGHYDSVDDADGKTMRWTVVSFTPELVLLTCDSLAAVGLKIRGQISSQGNSIVNGDWSYNDGSTGRFIATWGTALGDLPAAKGSVPAPQRQIVVRPAVCLPWFFSVVCE